MAVHQFEWPDRTWGNILAATARSNKDKPFVFFEDTTLTYAQLHERANRLANGLVSLGIKRGDKVGIMMPNRPEWLYHFFALAIIGAVDNPINVHYKGELLRHVVVNSRCRALVVDEQFLDRIKMIQDQLTTVETLIVLSDGHPLPAGFNFRTIAFRQLLDDFPAPAPPVEVRPADPLMVIYTSGTTGPSKGVVLSHNCLYLDALDWAACAGLTAEDVTYMCLPAFHLNHRFTMAYSMLYGARYAMADRFSATRFWDDARKFGATAFNFLGGMLHFLYAQPPSPNDRDHFVKKAVGIPVPEFIADFEQRFGVHIYGNVGGMTETLLVLHLTPEENEQLRREGRWEQLKAAGREHKALFELKLVDDDDREVPLGEPGELICRPARPYSMMSEYINNLEATVQSFRNLWFHTGDLYLRDPDGYIYFVDRKKDAIRRRGENISSFEVEQVVNAHPAVLESAAIAVKSPEAGEDDVKVLVLLKEGEKLDPADLIAWCETRMAYFMVPRYVEFRSELPRTPTGRVEKYRLRQECLAEATWDREKVGYKVRRN